MTARPKRPSVSDGLRMRVWMKDNGRCYICGLKILPSEKWEVEHEIARALTYDDSLDNLRVVHKVGCHERKTKEDVSRIAKAKRQAGEKGQQARRKKKGGSIPSAPFPKGQKAKWPSRPFPKKDKPK